MIRSCAAAAVLAVALGAALAGARSAAAEDYGAATLAAFAAAVVEVSRRIEEWRPRIEAAADADERAALVAEADADFARAVAAIEGITWEEYREIYDRARRDEALRHNILCEKTPSKVQLTAADPVTIGMVCQKDRMI